MKRSQRAPLRSHRKAGRRGLILLALATGCSPDDSKSSSEGTTCEQEVDQYIERISECLQVTAEERQQAIELCHAGEFLPGPTRAGWRAEFSAEVDACSDALTCDQLRQDLDDICFPTALATLAGSMLSATTIELCIEGGSSDCVAHLQGSPEASTSVVATCFNTWATCQPELPNSDPYWTEDQCSMIIALTDELRGDAAGCLSLACTQVAACLDELGAVNF